MGSVGGLPATRDGEHRPRDDSVLGLFAGTPKKTQTGFIAFLEGSESVQSAAVDKMEHKQILPAFGFIGLVAFFTYLISTFQPGWPDEGTLVAIRHVQSGSYLRVSLEDGLVYLDGNSSKQAAARFRLVTLPAQMTKLLKPKQVRAKMLSRKMCACTGFSDEHGFGRFCGSWESEHHHPCAAQHSNSSICAFPPCCQC